MKPGAKAPGQNYLVLFSAWTDGTTKFAIKVGDIQALISEWNWEGKYIGKTNIFHSEKNELASWMIDINWQSY